MHEMCTHQSPERVTGCDNSYPGLKQVQSSTGESGKLARTCTCTTYETLDVYF